MVPIYEFSCPECKHKFEELCKCNTESIPCPKCGATQTKRLFSAFGFAVSGGSSSSGSAASGCGSCSGGNCSTCH